VHRDDRSRGQPVAETLKVIGRDDVVGADHGAPRRVIGYARKAQPGGRVDDREIETDLVEAIVEQPRHHRGGAVECVFRLASPEGLLGDALVPPFGDRQRQRLAGRRHCLQKAVCRQIAADFAHLFAGTPDRIRPNARRRRRSGGRFSNGPARGSYARS
jgi:hypothetical protein